MSTAFAVDIVFQAKGGQNIDKLAGKTQKVDSAAKKAQGSLDQLTRKVSQSGRAIKRAANGMEYFIDATGRARKVNGQFVTTTEAAAAGLDKQGQAAKKTSGLLGGLRSQLVGLGVGASLGFAAKSAASFEQTQLRLKLLSQEFGEYGRIQKLVAQNAATFNQSQKESAENFANVYARLRPLGKSLEEIQTTYEGFNAVAIASGASAQEASSAFLQLSQALGSGRLQGDEFRSISEQVPGILKLVSKEMNVTVGELKQLGADGMITSDVLINSLAKGFEQNKDAIAELIALSPAQKFKAFQNATTELSVAVGQELLPVLIPLVETTTKLLQGFGKLPGPVKTAAVAIGAVGAAALIAAPAIGALASGIASFAPAAIAAGGAAKLLAGGLVILKAAMLALPWVALGAGVVALGVAVANNISNQRKYKELLEGTVPAVQNLEQNIKDLESAMSDKKAELARVEGFLKKYEQRGIKTGARLDALRTQAEKLRAELGNLSGTYDIRIRLFTEGTAGVRGGGTGAGTFNEKLAETKRQLAAMGYDYNGGSPVKLISASSAGGSSGGGGGGSSAGDRLEAEAKRRAEAMAAGVKSAEAMLRAAVDQKSVLEATTELEKIRAQGANDLANIAVKYADAAENALSSAEVDLLVKSQALEVSNKQLNVANQLDTAYGNIANNFKTIFAEGQAIDDAIKGPFEELAEEAIPMVGDAIQDSIVTALEAAITGADDLGESLQSIASDLLKQLGSLFISSAFNGIGAGLKLPGFADGGRPEVGKVSIVGERGPELFVPDSAGTVVSNKDSKAAMQQAMARYSPANAQSNAAVMGGDESGVGGDTAVAMPMNFSFNTIRIADEEYVSQGQLQQSMAIAAAQGAKAGEAKTLRRLQMSPGARRRMGI